jgi:uncharacterized membrane protein (DUF106 family)
MGFLAAPFKLIATYIIKIVVDILYKKLFDMYKVYKEKKESQEIAKKNLEEIKEAKTDDEKLKKRVDLLNGNKS